MHDLYRAGLSHIISLFSRKKRTFKLKIPQKIGLLVKFTRILFLPKGAGKNKILTLLKVK